MVVAKDVSNLYIVITNSIMQSKTLTIPYPKANITAEMIESCSDDFEVALDLDDFQYAYYKETITGEKIPITLS